MALALYGKATALLNPSAHGSTIELRYLLLYRSICRHATEIYRHRKTGAVVALALYGKATALLNPSAHGATIEVRHPLTTCI